MNNPRLRISAAAAIAAIIVTAMAGAASASAGGTNGAATQSAAHENLKGHGMTSARWDSVAAKANTAQTLIVGLNVDSVAEGHLDDHGKAEQHAHIHDAAERVKQVALRHGGRAFTSFEQVPFASVVGDSATVRALEHSPDVVSVDVDHAAPLDDSTVAGTGAAAGVSGNANLAANWSLGREQATYAQQQGYTGSGQTIAVLDTGSDRNHPALSGKVVSEACFSNYNASVTTGAQCPNGSTFQSGTGAAMPCTYAGGCGHGTSVASIAAGRGVGVAPGANIIAVDVFHRDASGPLSNTLDQTWGLWYVYQQRSWARIAAVNISIGGGAFNSFCDSSIGQNFDAWVQTLRSVGIPTVIASGNNGYRGWISQPSCDSHVIAVGNSTLDTNGNDALYTSSNSASMVDLVAPGTSIYSGNLYGQYGYWTGTSQATPAVVGAIAALRQLKPASSVDQLVISLTNTGPWVDDGNGVWKHRLAVWDALVYLYNH